MTNGSGTTGRAGVASAVRRLPQVAWLLVVWLLLWGGVSAKVVFGGLVVASAVTVLFPMPLLPALPLRPVALARLAGFVVRDVVVSSIAVSRQTLRYGPAAQGGIVEAPLHARSDREIAVLVAAVTLSPGTVVLQVDRPGARWYVYALGLHGPGDADGVRRQMLTVQRRVVQALGSEAEQRACAERGNR
ncbi:Na+/H+ antiporter subunit E [Pseudonocardia sp. RS010]|uniref:Na+/H+ antiporter subunit E n=1 Tax=Pseudonocardia sp. RS010 TaxID=3385979 RepID=UPI0039A282F8